MRLIGLDLGLLCTFSLLVWTAGAGRTHINNQKRFLIDANRAIHADQYRTLIGQGFTTNWFKSVHPLKKYRRQNVVDVYNAGFRNLRLRSRADLYPYPYNSANFSTFLDNLEQVVDDCIEVGLFPIISWIHHCGEAFATDADKQNYITWWTKVARRLQRKSYNLAFNLFTELGVDVCSIPGETGCHSPLAGDCSQSLRNHPSKYNEWTSVVIQAIRATGYKNRRRILILGAPEKTASHMEKVNTTAFDKFMMMEWHTYASGPSHATHSQKYWTGNGSHAQRQLLIDQITLAGHTTNLENYFGAWMSEDSAGTLVQSEVENFARFFCSTLKHYGIPWSLNVLDRYYDTASARWITSQQNVGGQSLNMSKVLDVIKKSM